MLELVDSLFTRFVTWTLSLNNHINRPVHLLSDPARNRTSDSANPGAWVYDNLNRMTASPGATYTNDVLGSRLSKNSTPYAWDRLGRMTHRKLKLTFIAAARP